MLAYMLACQRCHVVASACVQSACFSSLPQQIGSAALEACTHLRLNCMSPNSCSEPIRPCCRHATQPPLPLVQAHTGHLDLLQLRQQEATQQRRQSRWVWRPGCTLGRVWVVCCWLWWWRSSDNRAGGCGAAWLHAWSCLLALLQVQQQQRCSSVDCGMCMQCPRAVCCRKHSAAATMVLTAAADCMYACGGRATFSTPSGLWFALGCSYTLSAPVAITACLGCCCTLNVIFTSSQLSWSTSVQHALLMLIRSRSFCY
jgi:hypothetical protein